VTLRSTHEEQRRTSRRALQRAAIALVARNGFTGVTVDAIAAQAQVSRRTFFNHFPTKAAALFDPDPDDADRLSALLADADGAPDAWAALGGAAVAFVAGHEDVIAVRRELITESPELDQYHRTAHRHVEVAIEDWALRQQGLERFDAVLMAQAAAAVLTSAFYLWQPDQDPAELPLLVGRGFAVLSGGFSHTSMAAR
jgi:AcrR family transcriptional regulator